MKRLLLALSLTAAFGLVVSGCTSAEKEEPEVLNEVNFEEVAKQTTEKKTSDSLNIYKNISLKSISDDYDKDLLMLDEKIIGIDQAEYLDSETDFEGFEEIIKEMPEDYIKEINSQIGDESVIGYGSLTEIEKNILNRSFYETVHQLGDRLASGNGSFDVKLDGGAKVDDFIPQDSIVITSGETTVTPNLFDSYELPIIEVDNQWKLDGEEILKEIKEL